MAETLTFGSITIAGDQGGTYHCVNMEILYNTEHRGEDRLVPGAAGVIPNPRRLAPVTFTLQLVIKGTSHANVRSNIAALVAACAPIDTGDGTQSVTWSNGGTADCHVGPVTIGKFISPTAVRATLDIHLPAGEW